MNKYILFLSLLPLVGKAQPHPNSNRSIISSIEIGTTIYNTKVFEAAALVGLKDHNENSTFEIGYVYKRIITNNIGHKLNYHGLRAAIEVNLYGAFGAFGTYDVIRGDRWLFDNNIEQKLKLHRKIYGEGTLGIFLAPKQSLLKFYVGIAPFHYDAAKIKTDQTPHQSASINLKVKYTFSFQGTKNQ